MRSFVLAFLVAGSAHAAEITTLAGTGVRGFSGDGGPPAETQLAEPFGLTRGPDGGIFNGFTGPGGGLYFCDTANHRIRCISGTIDTVAGNGTPGYSGDGGPATSAALNEPYEIRFDADSNIFFVERLNHCVRRVDAKTGLISTIAGTGTAGFSGDGGPAVKAQFNEPHSIAFDLRGDLYIADVKNNRIRKVDMATGIVTTFAGTGEKKPTLGGAPFDKASLHGPRALAFDGDGNLWLALREGNVICKLDLRSGLVLNIAGVGGKPGFAGNGGPAKDAVLGGPKGIAVAPDGNVLFADTESHTIRMIDVQRGTVELVAGTGAKGDGPMGDPLACKLARPHGVFVDKDGTIFIGDSEANRVLMLRR